jgi:hypothetical protein
VNRFSDGTAGTRKARQFVVHGGDVDCVSDTGVLDGTARFHRTGSSGDTVMKIVGAGRAFGATGVIILPDSGLSVHDVRQLA